MYAENELFFPHYAIGKLRSARGPKFQELVDRVSAHPEDHPEVLAFSLMMVRIDGCLNCETDSYRAMRGCVPCAQQSLRRLKGDDKALIERFEKALEDVDRYLKTIVLPIPLEEIKPARAA